MLNRQKNDYYFNLFLNIVRAMYMQLEKDWDKEAKLCGISYAQQHALWLLHVQDGISLEELGNIAIWNKSTTSAIVSRLENKGLIKKEKVPGSRKILIYLTEKGRNILEKSINTKECLDYMALFKEYNEEDVIEILSVFKRILFEVDKDKNKDFNRFIDEYSNNLLK